MSPDQPNFFTQSEQLAQYEWEEQFDGRSWRIKVRVFAPFSLDRSGERYNTSVLIGGDWQPLHQYHYEPSEAELKARVKAYMPIWKATGMIY